MAIDVVPLARALGCYLPDAMRFRRLRTTIIVCFCLLMVVGGTVTTLIVRYSLSRSLMDAARDRGHAVAEIMAHQLAAPVAAGDWVTAQLLVDTESDHNAFVVLELPGDRILGSMPGGRTISDQARAVVGRTSPSVVDLGNEEALDVPAKIRGGTLGTVHVGVSLEPVAETTRIVVREVLATTAMAMLIGVAGIFFLSGLITRPISDLMRAARRMGEGDLDARAGVTGNDELAALAVSFNDMATDLKARIAASEQLRLYFERILDHLSKAVLVLSEDGRVEYANAAARATFGAREGQESATLFGEDRPFGALCDPSELVGQRTVQRTRDTADGHTYAISMGLLTQEAGKKSLVISVADVTDMKRLSDRLRRAERTAIAGEIASGIVHAINNPLDGLRRGLELAKKHKHEAERLDQLLTYAQEGTDRIAQVTRSLLSFARADEIGSPLTVAPLAILEEAAQLVSLRAEQTGVGVRIEVDPMTPPIQVDPHAMVDVVVNLLMNALDVSPRGSEIVASASPGSDGGTELRVTDGGTGIPDELRTRIFEPFFTTKDAGHGTGLGLSMARRIVESAGGEISSRTAAGGGAELVIWLPTSSPMPAGLARREACLDAS
jgi:signal transduction histidine kinase/HAMP domain-containing protein